MAKRFAVHQANRGWHQDTIYQVVEVATNLPYDDQDFTNKRVCAQWAAHLNRLDPKD